MNARLRVISGQSSISLDHLEINLPIDCYFRNQLTKMDQNGQI